MNSERIINICLDDSVPIDRTPEVEHEYKTAISDLLATNYFSVPSNSNDNLTGPYELYLSIVDNRLLMDIKRLGVMNEDTPEERKNLENERIILPISPFRGIIKDYFMVCESYYKAVRESTSLQLETMDMARRSLHNEGATMLIDVIKPEINVDFNTARRLFTLICVLHIR